MNFILILCVFMCGLCLGQTQKVANSQVMQIKKSVEKKLCSDTDYTDDLIAKIDSCDRFDPHYKIDSMYKECQDLIPNGGLSWNEKRKFNCKVRDCYEQKYTAKDYIKIWEEIRKLSDTEIEKKQMQKFECLEKLLQ